MNSSLANSDRSFYSNADLQYCVLPGKYLSQIHRQLYAEIFKFWHKSWSRTFSEIELPFAATSEEFCRHEEVTCLTYKGFVIACALVDYFDISNPVQQNHSYFANYPVDVLKKVNLASKNLPVFTFGYLAIDPDFRKQHALADLIVGLAVRRIQESANPLMITYTRNSRKTNDLGYRLGAHVLASNLVVRGESSDFIYFDTASMQTILHNESYSIMQKLWDEKIYVPSLNVIEKTKEGKTYEENRFDRSL